MYFTRVNVVFFQVKDQFRIDEGLRTSSWFSREYLVREAARDISIEGEMY